MLFIILRGPFFLDICEKICTAHVQDPKSCSWEHNVSPKCSILNAPCFSTAFGCLDLRVLSNLNEGSSQSSKERDSCYWFYAYYLTTLSSSENAGVKIITHLDSAAQTENLVMCLRSPESLFCFFLCLLTFHHFSIDKEEYKTNGGRSLGSVFIESQQASANSFLSCLCHAQSAFSEVAVLHFRCLFRCSVTLACGNDASAQV